MESRNSPSVEKVIQSALVRRFSFGRRQMSVDKVGMPKTPEKGCRIKVRFAGICVFDVADPNSPCIPINSPGFKNCSVYKGYEIAGIIDDIHNEAVENTNLSVGDEVVVFPSEEVLKQGYAEFITVRELKNLVKLPATVSMEHAAQLPTTAVKAMKTVQLLIPLIKQVQSKKDTCVVALVGAGSLCLWILRLLDAHWKKSNQDKKLSIIVTNNNESCSNLAISHGADRVVHWEEVLYEETLVERLFEAVHGCASRGVDIGICLVENSRSVNRLLKAFNPDGHLVVGGNFNCSVENEISLHQIPEGNVNDLKYVMELVASGTVDPPTYTVYPASDAENVYEKCVQSEVEGKAILKF